MNKFDAIDHITVNMSGNVGMIALNVVLALVMFGVALGIKPKMFIEVFKHPKSVILGVCSQLILLPALTFVLAILLGRWGMISWTMGLGMILVASCPGGNISNFISSLSKANIELSVSLTAISTALAVLTTPFNFWLYGNLFVKYSKTAVEVPTLEVPLMDVFVTIVILLGIPLVLGILTSQYLPKVAEKLKKPMSWLSIIFFLAMVVLAFMGNMKAFLACIGVIFIVVLIHNMLALLVGFGTGQAFRLPIPDKRTLTIETGIQNSGLGLGLLLTTHIFDTLKADFAIGGMVVIVAWWGVWHIIGGLATAGIFRWTDSTRQRKAIKRS